jgi:2-polyprenyl-6-methoxyphenol hydroxylase-like FAD-dependent oxidoreductase
LEGANCYQIYEQSQFANETGAAIHLAPNSNGVLRRYGLFAEEFGGVTMSKLTEYSANGVQTRHVDLTEPNKMWQHPWQLVHRVRLHNKLKEMATSKEGPGQPAALHVASRVLEVDPETATMTLENGETVRADLVLGADGIYSKSRKFVSGYPSKLFTSGKAAFRFLIPRKIALEDPMVAKICEREGELAIWYGDDRRVVMYPCDNSELLNFVCIHPEGESQGGADGEWILNIFQRPFG